MKKRMVSHETLLLVASNLTLAEVSATPQPDMPGTGKASHIAPADFVWRIFQGHVAQLQKQLETTTPSEAPIVME
jgi:hypothetical protein